MADLNKESMAIWKSLKPMIDEEIKAQTRGSVQRRKMKVTTAPSLVTNVIGVTEPYGSEMFIPFNTNLSAAHIGDVVWVEFMYGATNAFASMYASADTKDWTVGGDANIIGNATINGVLDVTQRRCSAILSSAGWYRVAQFAAPNALTAQGRYVFAVDMTLCNVLNDVHKITLFATNYVLNFTNEVSQTSGTQELDKIRYTYNGTDAFIDVHFVGTTGRTVKFFFDVQTNLGFLKLWTAQAFTPVADAPAGETVLVTHKFTDSTGVRSCTVTRVNNSYFDANAVSKLIAFSQNDTLYMRLFFNPSTSIPANTAYFEIATVSLPSNRILAHPLYFTIPGQSVNTHLLVYMTTGGSIRVANQSSVASGTTNYITTMAFPLVES